MKSPFARLATLLAVVFSLSSFSPAPKPAPAELKWYTWEEAIELCKTKPKKLCVDVYTDWCSWCKRMDKGTFTDPKVMEYLAANYYPVKFNAEQKESIEFKGQTFTYVSPEQTKGRGVHTLAYALLNGKMGYPSLVYLDETQVPIIISPGYKEAPDLMTELTFISEGHYKTTTWEEYKSKH